MSEPQWATLQLTLPPGIPNIWDDDFDADVWLAKHFGASRAELQLASIGGTDAVQRLSDFEALASLIEAMDGWGQRGSDEVDWITDDAGNTEVTISGEQNYGAMAWSEHGVFELCMKHSIAFRCSDEGKYEWPGVEHVWNPGMNGVRTRTQAGDSIAMTRSEADHYWKQAEGDHVAFAKAVLNYFADEPEDDDDD